jgi:hypothetical protein
MGDTRYEELAANLRQAEMSYMDTSEQGALRAAEQAVSALLGDGAPSPPASTAAAADGAGETTRREGETLDELREAFKVAELGVVEYEEITSSNPNQTQSK